MAVSAGLVALATHIYLQRFEAAARQAEVVLGELAVETVWHVRVGYVVGVNIPKQSLTRLGRWRSRYGNTMKRVPQPQGVNLAGFDAFALSAEG